MYSPFTDFSTRSITFNLIMINLIMLIASAILPQLSDMLSLHYFFNRFYFAQELMAIRDTLSQDERMMLMYTSAYRFQPFQMVTHFFMHAGPGHFFSNALPLFFFGSTLERFWGPKKFLLFYFSTAFGALVMYMAVQCYTVYAATGTVSPTLLQVQQHPEIFNTYFGTMVGASGAVFGILMAYLLLFPNTIVLYSLILPIPAWLMISVMFIYELYYTFYKIPGDTVAHFAHLGGALIGFVLIKIWKGDRRNFF